MIIHLSNGNLYSKLIVPVKSDFTLNFLIICIFTVNLHSAQA